MYRWYFNHTPSNPRLNNPRLLEDYIDWYMNIHLQEVQDEMRASQTPSSTTAAAAATNDMS